MKVLNEYPTHHYIDEYRKGDLFCPHCGKQEVWEEQSPGDYYCGNTYICSSCGCDFTIQGPNISAEANMTKIVKQLRTGIFIEPTTQEGH